MKIKDAFWHNGDIGYATMFIVGMSVVAAMLLTAIIGG